MRVLGLSTDATDKLIMGSALVAVMVCSIWAAATAGDGTTHARGARAMNDQWATTPGTNRHRCVAVGHRKDVRSGSFIVGNFVPYIRDWDGTLDTSKLYYVPLHDQHMAPLTVVAQWRGTPRQALDPIKWLNLATTAHGGHGFYATGTVLPHRGLWRLTATAGRNWGCFDLQL